MTLRYLNTYYRQPAWMKRHLFPWLLDCFAPLAMTRRCRRKPHPVFARSSCDEAIRRRETDGKLNSIISTPYILLLWVLSSDHARLLAASPRGVCRLRPVAGGTARRFRLVACRAGWRPQKQGIINHIGSLVEAAAVPRDQVDAGTCPVSLAIRLSLLRQRGPGR